MRCEIMRRCAIRRLLAKTIKAEFVNERVPLREEREKNGTFGFRLVATGRVHCSIPKSNIIIIESDRNQ